MRRSRRSQAQTFWRRGEENLEGSGERASSRFSGRRGAVQGWGECWQSWRGGLGRQSCSQETLCAQGEHCAFYSE